MKFALENYAKVFSRLTVVLVPVIYFLYSLAWTGPAYLTDEIGYLNKASALGGHIVDGASSWHGGYSFFLAPLFALLDSSAGIWTGAMLVNALLWLGSFAALYHLLKSVFPDVSETTRYFALAISTIYPAWITITGYVFPSSAFVFVLLIATISLLKWTPENTFSIVFHSVLTGFLYWIHPTGLGVVLASAIAVAAISHRSGNYRGLGIHLLLLPCMVLLYQKGVHPWLNDLMTTGYVSPREHYPGYKAVYDKLFLASFWGEFFVRILGQFSYLVISSFGLVAFGACFFANHLYRTRREVEQGRDLGTTSLAVFLPLAMMFVVALGAALFSIKNALRTDHWIYGRYAEATILPIIAIGVVTLLRSGFNTKRLVILLVVPLLLATGGLIDYFGGSTVTANLINVSAFWPLNLYRADTGNGFFLWMLMGTTGVILAAFHSRFSVPGLMLASLALSTFVQFGWHKTILAKHSKPSALVEFVTSHFAHGACVGFEYPYPRGVSLFQVERFNLYSYYFFDYTYRRLGEAQWKAECDGPLLTFVPEKYAVGGYAQPIARENASGLSLVVKNAVADKYFSGDIRQYPEVIFARKENDPCLMAGCFSMNARSLAQFSLAGRLDADRLVSTGKPGFMFFGPYQALKKGRYLLSLKATFTADIHAVLDIVGETGKKTYLKRNLCDRGCAGEAIQIPFELERDVQDLEIRLNIGNAGAATVLGYEISMDET